jgi:DNA-directed RNA polymerase specialized sigma subunit
MVQVYHRNKCMTDQEILEMAIKLARSIARRKARQYYQEAEELEGYLLEKFVANMMPRIQKARGTHRFNPSAYIKRSFNGYILNFLRDHAEVVKVPRKIKNLYLEHRVILKTNPDLEESQVAKEMGIHMDELREMKEAMAIGYKPRETMHKDLSDVPMEAFEIDDDQQQVFDFLCDLDDDSVNLLMDHYYGDKKLDDDHPLLNSLQQLPGQKHN